MEAAVRFSRLRGWRRFGAVILLACLAQLVQCAGPMSATAGPPAGGVVTHGSRAVPVVALTIDDGFSGRNCMRIARILAAKGATATFFPIARAVSASPAAWRWIAAQGFPIGNHTTTHRSLTGSFSKAYAEIASARRIIEAITGRPMVGAVRPPRGEWDGTTIAAAAAAGFGTVLLWDTTFADTSSASDAAHIRSATRGTYGSVILMHAGTASIRILPAVIDAYHSRGIEFVTVPELLRLRAAPATWSGFARVLSSGPYVPPVIYGPTAERIRVPHAVALVP